MSRELVLATAALVLASGLAQSEGLQLYVATNGNDAWSGTLPAPNAARTDGPFATLMHARDALRAARQAAAPQPATVFVRGGRYLLDRTFVLTEEDSGTAECPVTFCAQPGETAQILGAKPVRNWKREGDGLYVTQLAEQGFEWFRFHQLFFRGERQTLARHPNLDPAHPHTGGMLYVDAPSYLERSAFYYDKGEVPFEAWGDWSQAEVNIWPYHCWDHNIIPVADVDTASRHIRLKYPVAGQIYEANRYFVQNALGALDAPGEWYVDYGTGKLSFRPPGGTVADGDVMIPVLENLIALSGTPEAPVRYVNVRGFHLACAEQDAIALEGAEHCEITGNVVSDIGGVGVNAG